MLSKTWVCVGIALTCAWGGPAFGQPYTRFLTGFEAGEGYQTTDEVIWMEPLWSGSTVRYANTSGIGGDPGPLVEPDGIWEAGTDEFGTPWSESQVVDWGAFAGTQSYVIYFIWGNPPDTDDPPGFTGPPSTGGNDLVRCTTYAADYLSRPSVHLGGKIRFKMAVLAYADEFYTPIPGGETASILVSLGIRETGNDIAQGDPDTGGGDIEWVYMQGSEVIPDAGTDGLLPELPNDDPNYPYRTTPPGGKRFNATTAWPPSGGDWYSVEFDLGNPAAVRGFANNGDGTDTAGDGQLDATLNPSGEGVNRGVLENIAFTNDPIDIYGAFFFIWIDDVEFESLVPDPVTPPSVVWPIVAGQTQVMVTDLMATTDKVALYVNGNPIATNGVTPPADDTVFTISPAVTGDVYTATQHDGVTGDWSEQSVPVTVLSQPPPYSFSILLDEGGTGSCNFTTGWEWVGVTSVSGWAPQGTPVVTDDAVWQTVDIPLDDDNVVIAGLGGDGQLLPSPTGVYTIDSVWFTIAPGADTNGLGPWEVFVDAVQLITSNGSVGETILNMEDGVNRMQYPRGQSPVTPTSSALSQTTAYDGLWSHRLEWSYPDTSPGNSLGMLQRIQYTCGTSALIDDSSLAIRFHLLCRAQPTSPGIPLPEVAGPIIVGTQDTVRVNIDATATSVQLYLNGVAEGPPITTNGVTEVDFTGLTLQPGDSVSAKQTLPGGESDFAYPHAVSAKPLPPTVNAPIFPGAMSVTVSNLLAAPHATAYAVWVYSGAELVGAEYGGTETVVVPMLRALDSGEAIIAIQTVNDVDSDPSDPVIVGIPGPVIYRAPAEGDTVVRVVDVNTNASLVTVTVGTNGTTFTEDPGGNSWVDVPVSGLLMGDIVTANMTVGGEPSGQSDPETVTTNVVIDTPVCDNFESYADQAAMNAFWTQAGTPDVLLATDKNATCPSGAKSAYGSTGLAYMTRTFTDTTPTATEPLVLNVNMYDPVGVDPGGLVVNWVEINALGSGSDYFYMHVGMLGWANTDNVHYDLRVLGNGGPNWVDLDEYDGPDRSIGWHTFTYVHKGNLIDVYVDGLLSKKNLALTSPTTCSRADIGGGYASAEGIWFDDFCAEIGPVQFGCIAPQAPPAPRVSSPILDGDTTVTITDVGPDVTNVTVYDETPTVIGTYNNPAGTNGTVEVTLSRALVHLERITADQTNAVGMSSLSAPLEVGNGNGPIMLGVGIRETGDTGPLGSEGSGTGDIEWINVTTNALGEPIGVSFVPTNGWRTITFDPANGVTGFIGNGVIDGTRGTLEHLAFWVDSSSPDRSSGVYRMYVDNVINVNADGGGDFLITDFEGYALDSEVLFQEPTFSGTTDGHLSYPPSASATTDEYAGGGSQSQLITWFWRDTDTGRWVRDTTFQVANIPSPIIDITRPIRMDILLLAGCDTPGDVDGDGDVDLDDMDEFVGCLDGPSAHMSPECQCADLDGDGNVDLADYGELQQVLGP